MADMLAKAPVDRRIADLIAPTVVDMGFELVRVRLMGGRKITLQIMAERPDGRMEIDDCAELSRALSAVLDVEDPIDREYSLEVSSPGIDRPLTRPEDFSRWAGWTVRLETEGLIDGRKRFKGELTGFEDGAAVVALDTGEEARVPFDQMADAKLVLTDELIAASLKAQQDKGFDPSQFDDVVEQDDEDAEQEPQTEEQGR